jgi:integrase
MERSLPLQQIGRLGFCKQASPRPEADMGQAILRKYIRPVAQSVGIQKRFGWHTFRHTYATLLRSVGTEFKVMQELMRHSSLRSTLDVYTQAISPAKHAAQAAVLALVFASETNSIAVS